jgi:hypothetical protein
LGSRLAPPWRRRAAFTLIVAGAAGAYWVVAPKLPHDQQVVLELGEAAPEVTRLDVSWSRSEAPDDPVVSTRWHFEAGRAPGRLNVRVRVSDGAWIADVSVTRAGSASDAHATRRVNFDGSPITVPLREVLQ